MRISLPVRFPSIIIILMSKLNTTKSMIFSHKGEFDDSSSITSSTITYRLSRRKDQQSSERKSISRKSSEKSLQDVDISKFYVKMSPAHEPKGQSPTRRNIMNRIEEPLNLKKRSPTPLPGYNRKKQSEKSTAAVETIETDVLIAQLQQKWKEEKDGKELFQKRLVIFQKEIKAKLIKIQQLQTLYASSKQRQEASSNKLQRYQQIISINEANLSQARTSLQKLKNTIKQSRYAQIELDNNRLNAQNKILKQDIQSLQQENSANKQQISKISNQISMLQAINQELSKESRLEQKNKEIKRLQQIIVSSKSQRQDQLQKCLKKITQDKVSFKLKIDKLEIQLNYISRKKNQEIEALKESKNQVIMRLRSKINNLYTQNAGLQKEVGRLKEKSPFGSTRKNIFFQENDQNLFELTPQK